MRHMQSIIHKRILLYDHRRNLVIDSYNFTRAQHIGTQDIPPPDRLSAPDNLLAPDSLLDDGLSGGNQSGGKRSGGSRSGGNLSGSTPFQNDLASYPAYLRPPSGGSSLCSRP